tara:strand:+ start:1531 stop:1737 length:207 start_codon:yes stop_codon:yes gene_type:complete
LLCIDFELLFFGSQFFVFYIDKYAFLKVGVCKIPRILYTCLGPVFIDGTDVFILAFTHANIVREVAII